MIEKKVKMDLNVLFEVYGFDILFIGFGWYLKLVDINFLRKYCEL